MYEAVIEDMQREKQNPFQNRSHVYGGESAFRSSISDSKLALDTNAYVSNLLRKISLLDDQVKFEKS